MACHNTFAFLSGSIILVVHCMCVGAELHTAACLLIIFTREVKKLIAFLS